jgi:hypothetical protein
MSNATVLAPPRRGLPEVNAALDLVVSETEHLAPGELAELLAIDSVVGYPDTPETPSAGPVGRWIIGQLQSMGHPAVAYSWVGTQLAVYDAALRLIGEVCTQEGSTLWDLDCEVNDLERPELTVQGEGDPR